MMIRALIVIGAAIVLVGINVSIVGKEKIKRDGEVIYLDLLPRDPRSLMQGDYMALRFRLAQEIEASWQLSPPSENRNRPGAATRSPSAAPHEGEIRLASIEVSERRVASLAKADAVAPLKIRYRMRNRAVWLGTNAFFFEEGSDKRYSSARYGEFRLDKGTGEAVLVGLRDVRFNAL